MSKFGTDKGMGEYLIAQAEIYAKTVEDHYRLPSADLTNKSYIRVAVMPPLRRASKMGEQADKYIPMESEYFTREQMVLFGRTIYFWSRK